jgi:hypothetical protein
MIDLQYAIFWTGEQAEASYHERASSAFSKKRIKAVDIYWD